MNAIIYNEYPLLYGIFIFVQGGVYTPKQIESFSVLILFVFLFQIIAFYLPHADRMK